MPLKLKSPFYGWTLLFILWFIHVMVVGFCFYGPPVLFPHMISALGWGRTDVSLGFMVSVISMGFSCPLAAWSVGRFGARACMVTGSLIGATGFFLTQFISIVPVYIVTFGVLAGLGWAFGAVIPVQTLIAHWFHKRRGLAFGLVWSGGAIGGLIAPSILNGLINYFDGRWQVGWLCMCLLMVLAAIVAGIGVKNRPEDLGQLVDGEEPVPAGFKKLEETPNVAGPAPSHWTFSKVVRTREFWLMVVCIVGNVFGWQLILTQSPLHLADRGFSSQEYSVIYGFTVGLTIIGSLGTGALSDRYDPRRIILLTTLLGLIGNILFWFVRPDNPITMTYPLFSAIAIGANAVMPPIFIGKYWGVFAFAKINGYLMPITTLMNSMASPIAGAIFDHNGSYFYAVVICWIMMVLAMTAVGLMKPAKVSEP